MNCSWLKMSARKAVSNRSASRHSVGTYTDDELLGIPKKKSVKLTGIDLHTLSGHSNPTPDITTYGGIKLGWIQGVLIPCLLNIWGVMLFLRISWIVGQAGIAITAAIIMMSAVVCVVTTLSMSALCTNGELQGGGVYYLVSRSLGAELGASVGIIFALANAVAASMNTIGFCDSLNELLQSKGLKILDNGVNDVRIVGAIALLVMCVICAIGMDWETKTQNFLITTIVLAIINFVVGVFYGPKNDVSKAQGFVGINFELAQRNWLPDFRFSEGKYHNFFSVFAMYFPAVTGVQAGANICGDLKNPATAIPKGTLLALAISVASYLTMAVLSGMAGMRDASGVPGNLTLAALEDCKPNCPYGLHNNYQIMQLMALWGPLIYGGCWAATLSTALTNLLSVPRLIQALGIDRIYPGLIFFSKSYGRHGEPYRGYALTFIVSLLFLLIADLNTIAPLITNFYLASYALINFCTFHAAFVQQINWRPTFHFYNKWLSLLGFLMCVTMMVIISWFMALLTTFIFMTLYLLVLYTKPEANWGSSTDAQQYQTTLASILNISRRAENIKSYNPQLLVLAGKPYKRPALIDMAHLITRIGSFMIVADIEKTKMDHDERMERIHQGEEWLFAGKRRGFYVLLDGCDLDVGVTVLAQASGLGRLTPNIVMLGFQTDWISMPHEYIHSYFKTVRNAFLEKMAVIIFRVDMNYVVLSPSKSNVLKFITPSKPNVTQTKQFSYMHSTSDIDGACMDQESIDLNDNESAPSHSPQLVPAYSPSKSNVLGFGRSVDVWWLYDDGGLNILIPYIIARRASNKKLPLRIFALAKAKLRKDEGLQQMKLILAKYRIEYTELIMVTNLNNPPLESSWQTFNELIKNFKTQEEHSEVLISELELNKQYSKICRHLRLREMLLDNSSAASLIVMSLPLPRKGMVSATMYMAWLEVLSADLPPTLFVRGNTMSVLAT